MVWEGIIDPYFFIRSKSIEMILQRMMEEKEEEGLTSKMQFDSFLFRKIIHQMRKRVEIRLFLHILIQIHQPTPQPPTHPTSPKTYYNTWL